MMGVTQISTAQIVITPDPVYLEGIEAGDLNGIAHSFVENQSSGNMNITWERTIIDMTEGWASAVCDLNQCYLSHISSQAFGLGSGLEGLLDVYVYPNDIEGSAIIEMEVFATNDPSVNYTATYYFNQGTSGIAERLTEAIKVYPNPTQDYVNIESPTDVYRVQLFDVSGKMVISVATNGAQRFSIENLSSGNYILKMMDINSEIVSTNLLVKE